MSQPENNTKRKPAKKSRKKRPPSSSRKSKKQPENASNPDSFPQEMPEGLETLIDIPARKDLPHFVQPERGRRAQLPIIIRHAPDLYAKMMMYVASGVSPNIACEVIGIKERTFYEWGQLGSLDLAEDPSIDSYYSRFCLDVRRAIANAAADCEIAIKESDPYRWLSQGPGRIFSGPFSTWGDSTRATRSLTDQRTDASQLTDNAFTHNKAPSSPQEGPKDCHLIIDQEHYSKTQEILDSIGHGTDLPATDAQDQEEPLEEAS